MANTLTQARGARDFEPVWNGLRLYFVFLESGIDLKVCEPASVLVQSVTKRE